MQSNDDNTLHSDVILFIVRFNGNDRENGDPRPLNDGLVVKEV